MFRKIMLLVACLVMMSGVFSCDEPNSQTSGGGSHVRAKSNDSSVVLVNGDKIPASELLAAPALRQGIRQFIYFHNLRKVAEREGVTADPKALEEHISLVKQRLTERGDTWEGYLSELSITEDEYRSNIEESLLQDAIVEKRVGVTDERMREVWDDQMEKVIDEYMGENYLPDSERSTVTYEMCHDILFAKVMRIDGVPVLGDLNAELLDTASLEITCMSDPEQAKLYEFLILLSAKTATEDEKTPTDSNGEPTSPDGPAGDGESTGGIDTAAGG